MGTILCVILILTLFNVEKVHGKFVSMCYYGQRSSNDQNYAIVCPSLTYL